MMMMMVGVVLNMVGVIVVVDVIDQDQNQLADLSGRFCSSFLETRSSLVPWPLDPSGVSH